MYQGEVGVHLHDALGSSRFDELAERLRVGGTETLFGWAVEHRDEHRSLGQAICELARAVGRGIVDDQEAVSEGGDGLGDQWQVCDLVVGRDDDRDAVTPHSRGRSSFGDWPTGCFA